MNRPSFDAWALGIARAVATRGDCTRRKVGAVLLSAGHDVIGIGYNGAWSGGPSCLAGECPRGRHYRAAHLAMRGVAPSAYPDGRAVCACGNAWPCPDAVSPGSSYDTGPGQCIASHAEQNCLARVGQPWRIPGSTLYVTDQPCEGCVKQIRNTTQIAAICWPDGYTALP
jgi:dCMP deaminase